MAVTSAGGSGEHDLPAMRKLQESHGSYVIERLLAHRVQPFEDLVGEEFEAFKKSLETAEKADLLVPIILSKDGWLIDGSQRCRAIEDAGQKTIRQGSVRVDMSVSGEDEAMAKAVQLQLNRRNLNGAQKARIIRQWQRKGWSQTLIAERFGQSQPSISKLLKNYPATADEEEVPELTTGVDGKVYPKPEKRNDARVPKPVWSDDGRGTKAISEAGFLLDTEDIADPDGYTLDATISRVRELILKANAALVRAGAEPVLTEPPAPAAVEPMPGGSLEDPAF